MWERYNDSSKDGEQLRQERDNMMASHTDDNHTNSEYTGSSLLGKVVGFALIVWLIYAWYSGGVVYFTDILAGTDFPESMIVYASHALVILSVLMIVITLVTLSKLLASNFVKSSASVLAKALGVCFGILLGFIGLPMILEGVQYSAYISVAGMLFFGVIGFKKPKWTIFLGLILLVFIIFTGEPPADL